MKCLVLLLVALGMAMSCRRHHDAATDPQDSDPGRPLVGRDPQERHFVGPSIENDPQERDLVLPLVGSDPREGPPMRMPPAPPPDRDPQERDPVELENTMTGKSDTCCGGGRK
ncbi:uncharacterized protein LOC144630540 [Oculina patagonica]